MRHSQPIFQMTENTNTETLSNASLQCGAVQLQDTVERCMKNHWEDFRRDSQHYFQTFYTDYIEPSIQFIEKEKQNANEKYRLLENDNSQLKSKCSDLERYNTLLQEKIEAVEKEMKSFSQVSMIAKWEKQLHDKSKECKMLQASLDKSKRVAHRLKQENTVLNTRLELLEKETRRRNFVSSARSYLQTAVVAPQTDSRASTITTAEKVVNTVDFEVGEAELSEATPQHHTILTAAQTTSTAIAPEPRVVTALEESDTCVHSTNTTHNEMSAVSVVGISNKPILASMVETSNKPAESDLDAIVCVVDKRTTSLETVDDSGEETQKQPDKNTEASPLLSNCEDVRISSAEEGTELVNRKDADALKTTERCESDITYKIKMLKRSRNDAEKTKYLFGSDKNLYQWREGNVPGALVGQQLEKNGRNVFKFAK